MFFGKSCGSRICLRLFPRCTRRNPGPPGAPAANREGRLKSRDELACEVEVLGARIATLSAAVLRLGSSLDLATVLQEAPPTAPARSTGFGHGGPNTGFLTLFRIRLPCSR